MKVALAQINTTVGGFKHNTRKILEFVEKAALSGADLVVYPELALSSYPPLDLLDRPGFIQKNEEALGDLMDSLSDMLLKIKDMPSLIVLGSITKNQAASGRAIQNSALLLENKGTAFEVVLVQPKRLLPTYDVFDESRYFEPGLKTEILTTKFGKIALTICEDAWFEDEHRARKIYKTDPATDLKDVDLVINIAASPFEINKRIRRKEMLASFIKKIKVPLVYVNQVGANDEILFDGSSQVYSRNADVLAELPAFEEGIMTVELNGGLMVGVPRLGLTVGVPRLGSLSSIALVHKGLVTGIRDYFAKTGFTKAVIGLSGGIDSAVVAVLAVEALGHENVIGVAMPGHYSSSHSLSDAEALALDLGIEFKVHSIKFINTAVVMEVKPSFYGMPPDVTEENIQSRLRAVLLLAIANKRKALVLTTGNKSELAVGYCTLYGDMAGALAPLGDLYKTRVYELASHLNKQNPRIPESIIKKPPSAELSPNQLDEQALGSYDALDKLLEAHIEGLQEESELTRQGFDPITVQKILRLVHLSEFKRRQAAPVLKITSKAFGIGRRISIAKSL